MNNNKINNDSNISKFNILLFIIINYIFLLLFTILCKIFKWNIHIHCM